MARKNRPTAEIPNGSMADIAFLLLIFFLVTTTIANDKGIAMLLPPKPDPNQPPLEVTKMTEIYLKYLLTQDRLLVEDEPLEDVNALREMVKTFILNFGNPGEEGVEIYNSLPGINEVTLFHHSVEDLITLTTQPKQLYHSKLIEGHLMIYMYKF